MKRSKGEEGKDRISAQEGGKKASFSTEKVTVLGN